MRPTKNIVGETIRIAVKQTALSVPFVLSVRAIRAVLETSFVVLAAFFATIFLAAASRVDAAEDWRRFLEALDERGYGDVAVDYLKSLQDAGTAPPELASELDFRLGLATLDSLASAPPSTRDGLAASARGSLEKFIANNPDSPSNAEANAALGRLLTSEGGRSLEAASKPNVSDAERERLATAARAAFSDAKQPLETALKAAYQRAKSLQDAKDSNPNDLNRAQGTFLDLTIRRETLRAQSARTYPKNSQNWSDGLTKARANFEKIYTTYRQYAGAYQARYFEAEIARELGDVDGALSALSELAVLPFEPQFYTLKTRTLLLFSEIATERGTPTDAMNIIKKFNDWKDAEKLPKSYYRSAEGLQIRLFAVKATIRLETLRRSEAKAFAEAGRKTFTDSNDPTYQLMNLRGKTNESNKIVVFALENLAFVANGVGAEANEAQELLKNPLFEGLDLSQYSFGKSATTFEGAVSAARRAAAAHSQARRDAVGATTDADDEARRRIEESAQTAYSAFQDALSSADAQTPPEELDPLRLQFSAFCFATERFDEAFATSDDLVRNRADFADAPTAATVALRSLQALVAKERSKGADDVELAAARRKVVEYAEFVLKRWSADERPVASGAVQEASLVQMELAIDAGDVEAARTLLEQIPDSSPRRADAELRLGGALWNAWNERKKNDSANVDDSAANAESAVATEKALLDGAQKALYDGLERKIRSSRGVSESDETMIFYVFQLAQVFETQGNLREAEDWLNHPVIGPSTFVKKKLEETTEPAANAPDPDATSAPENVPVENAAQGATETLLDDNFQMAVLALELTILTADATRLDEAEKIVSNLERLVERTPENAAKLTGVYLRLGRRLEDRLRELKSAAQNDAAKEAELSAATKGFEAFLERAAKRDAGTGYASLRWIADSFLSLGNGLSDKQLVDPPKEALDYFARAGRTYQTILKKIDADPNFAPNPSARLAVSLKIVECLRSAGAYSKAFDQIKTQIKAAPNNLDVQLEAARILQGWGRKDSKYYLNAIVGGAPDANGRNVVWGWNGTIKKLGTAIDRGERFKEAFYDAYFAKTECRYLYARRLKDETEREKQARDAENDLRRLYQTRPDLGGPASFAKLDNLFKVFQKLRGEKNPIGLRADAKKNAAQPVSAQKPIETKDKERQQ